MQVQDQKLTRNERLFHPCPSEVYVVALFTVFPGYDCQFSELLYRDITIGGSGGPDPMFFNRKSPAASGSRTSESRQLWRH